MVNAIVNTYTVKAGDRNEGNLALSVLVGQKEHPHEKNCIIDTGSSLSRGTEVKIMKFPLSCKQIPLTGVYRAKLA